MAQHRHAAKAALAGAVLVVVCAGRDRLRSRTDVGERPRKLTPVPQNLLIHDQELRSQLGTPDLRYMLVVEAADDNAALIRLESLDTRLAELKRRGVISGYDDAARYLPTRERQLARQRTLPDED